MKDRSAARISMFGLLQQLQTGSESAASEICSLSALAEDRGWSEVVRIGLFGQAVTALFAGGAGMSHHVRALLERSIDDGDRVMTALALALRSLRAASGDDHALAVAADNDLARAAVMLETAKGGALERVSGHTACGIGFGGRGLWELGDEPYAAALATARPRSRPPWTTSSQQSSSIAPKPRWPGAAPLRALGDADGVAARWATFRTAADAANSFRVPPAWREELETLGILLASIAGEDRGTEARHLIARAANEPSAARRLGGHLELAVALSDATAHRPGAGEAAERAIRSIDEHLHPQEYELALHIAAELDDDLTGVGNRRALERYLADLAERQVASVAFIMADVDRFKAVNDVHGHAAGDAALIRVARALQATVRPGDLVVRLGGDEFAMVLAGADIGAARDRAQSVLDTLERLSWGDISPGLGITVSAGVTAGSPQGVEVLGRLADSALYEAKEAGGGRVVLRPPAD